MLNHYIRKPSRRQKKPSFNDEVRARWVENYEPLYNAWRRSGVGLTRWVREHRGEIDSVIRQIRDGE